MRRFYSPEFMRIFWPHWLGGILFIGLYAFQLLFLLRERPDEPDPASGYTIEFGTEPEAVYLSSLDMVLLYGTFFVGMLIVTSGLWRVWRAQKLSASSKDS
jgi:hypothetical protein